MERQSSWFKRALLHPCFATGIMLSFVFAGVLASIWPKEITSSAPWNRGNLSIQALGFWLFISAGGSFHYFRERLLCEVRNLAEMELTTKADELMQLVTTMPPNDCLYEFARAYEECEEMRVITGTFNNALLKSDVFDFAIRQLLRKTASLARYFDKSTGEAYACNLMIFIPSDDLRDLSAEEHTSIKSKMKFAEDGTEFGSLRGVLHLNPHFSARTDLLDGEIDTYINEFYLPIPQNLHGTMSHKISALPGAPYAFMRQRASGCSDATKIIDWCTDRCAFSAEVTTKVDAYFQRVATENIGSFVSFPLCPTSSEGIPIGNSEVPMGVMNIHRMSPGLLGDKERIFRFGWLAQPIILLILHLLEKRAKITAGG